MKSPTQQCLSCFNEIKYHSCSLLVHVGDPTSPPKKGKRLNGSREDGKKHIPQITIFDRSLERQQGRRQVSHTQLFCGSRFEIWLERIAHVHAGDLRSPPCFKGMVALAIPSQVVLPCKCCLGPSLPVIPMTFILVGYTSY